MDTIIENINSDRIFFSTLGNIYPADRTVSISDTEYDGVKCYWFVPENYNEDSIIIYLHGGAYVLGSIQSHRAMVSHFATALAARILFIEYGLAPENPFPQARNEIFNVYKSIIQQYPKAKISMIGDSAGGGLAVSFIGSAIKERLKLPSSVVLISPWIYLKCDTESHIERKELDQILNTERLLRNAEYYSTGNWTEADPGQINFENFPPTFILVGTNEILFDDSRLFYEKIKSIQPKATLKVYPDQGHVWPLSDIHSKASQEALADIKSQLAV